MQGGGAMQQQSVPVIAITGHLGAGKTTLLNHLLRAPGARLGVIVNDFGTLNVDAVLVTGQIDEVASISGGCLCCLPDAGGLDQMIETLAQPRLRLDAILIEASGAADPLALARLIRYSSAAHTRPGGIVEVVDAVEYFRTVDTRQEPPLRAAAASLVAIGKTDLLPVGEREHTVARISERIRMRNPHAPLVLAERGTLDLASTEDPPAELPIARLLREEPHGHGEHHHQHAQAASIALVGPVAAGALVSLLEDPPAGAYRIKGRVRVRGSRADHGYLVNVVGPMIHVAALPAPPAAGELVAIGMQLYTAAAERRLRAVAASGRERADAAGLQRIAQYRRLSA